jgi:TRAP-type C4-dicarboxylate transport system substrate-binding protein
MQQRNDLSLTTHSGHYEVAKYYSLDAHMAPPAMLLMSQKLLEQAQRQSEAGSPRGSQRSRSLAETGNDGLPE